jgi:CxxC motif-containing protein
MEKTNMIYCSMMGMLILLVFSSVIYSGGHDSLLFDAAQNRSGFSPDPCGCKIKIIKQKGMVRGTFCERDIDETCGEKDTVYKKIKSIIPSYATDVMDGDTIMTGDFDGSEVDLELSDGKKIHMGRNVSFFISKDHCTSPISIVLHYGLLYLDFSGGDKYKTVGIKTQRGEVINRGTRYTVETITEGVVTTDIIRVYEGSVTVNQSSEAYINEAKKNEAETVKLAEDYQAGRISVQDFAKRMGEIQADILKAAPRNVIVEAGYETRMVGWNQPTDPVAFDVTEKRW